MSAEGLNGTATADDIRHCYRVFLGRDAETEAVIEDKVGQSRLEVLGAFITSGEFGSQVFHRILSGLPPATPLHDQSAHPDAATWVSGFFGMDESLDGRLRGAGSGLELLAAAATGAPVFLATLAAQFGDEPTTAFNAALQADAINSLRRTVADDVVLTLRCGSLVFGSLGRSRPEANRPSSRLDIWDFGLADFARLCKLDDFALVTMPRDGAESVYPLPLPDPAPDPEPLATRRWLHPRLKLADLWFASRRDLALRYEGDGTARVLDVYQCGAGGRLIKLVAGAAIGQPVAIVPAKLFNPFAPVLLVIREPSGGIVMFDHLPFPSFARGGLHAAERAICGHGGDDVADIALLSAELLALLLRRHADADRTIATIHVDPVADTGIEPIYDSDLLDYLADCLGVFVASPAPAGQVERFRPDVVRDGPALLLPADAVPCLSALIRPIPPHARAQTVTGSRGIIDWDRQGQVHSVWIPPVGDWLDDLQWRGAKRAAPMMRIGEGGSADLCLGWPLALTVRPIPLAETSHSPFEIAAEIDLPLLRTDRAVAEDLDIVILFEADLVSPIPLLESIARQDRLGEGSTVILCRPAGASDPAIVTALDGLFPGRGRVIGLHRGAGRLEQLMAVRADLKHDSVLVADAATLLTDRRTLATLATMLSQDGVASAGCLIRTIEGDRRLSSHGGYVLTHADLRTTPALAFSPADLEALGGPITLPVAANTMAAMLIRRDRIDRLPPQGSAGDRPAEDDILLGLAALQAGMLNLCTSVVSAHSERPAPFRTLLGRALPYRLDAQTIDRLVNAAAVIQRVR